MKYMGSKSRIVRYICPLIQAEIDRHRIQVYCEPFAGGMNVIQHIRCERRIASDINAPLIALFKHLQSGGALPNAVPRELYNNVRANQGTGKYELWLVGAVGFLASYNGRFFDGGYAQPGYETLKNGQKRYRDYYQESKSNILSQIPSLKGVEFHCQDYLDTCLMLATDFNNIMYYCDPPYHHKKNYSSGVYTSQWYDEFWHNMAELSKHNVVVISEESAPPEWKCIWEQEVSRTIKAQDKSRSVEKLFMLEEQT